MNKARRKTILEAREQLDALRSLIEELYEDESDYFDNMPESLQSSARGEASEAAIEHLEGAIDWIDEAMSELELAAE